MAEIKRSTAMRGLRQMRQQAELTQDDVAAALGVTRQAVSLWEAGLAVPGKELLAKLCGIFGCSAGRLFDGTTKDEEVSA